MRRFAAIAMVLLILSAPLASGCVRTGDAGDGKLSIVCTVFPQYDWVRQILGDRAGEMNLTLLINNRIDLHNYQPSVEDIVKISTCDLFIYVGGESDKWVGGILGEGATADMAVINLLELLGDSARIEEIVEGMEDEDHDDHDSHGDGDADDDHDKGDDYDDHDEGDIHDDHDDGDDDHDHEADFDEHVWLSLRNAHIFCTAIADALSSLDAANAAQYSSNAAAYIGELSALDAKYQAALDAAAYRTLLFGDRFPFRYLVDDYGLSYYAAFSGCSAETEASFETIVFLARKMDELMLPCVMVTESSDQSIARTIIQNTAARNYKICVLDAMQSVTSGDVQSGATYISIMESNLGVLRDALK